MSYADLVVVNGRFYTMDKENNIAGALAVRDGKITDIGDYKKIKARIGSRTRVLDAKGRAVLPGLVEPHVHAPGKAYTALHNIDLFDARTVDKTLEKIEAFVRRNPGKDRYYGRGFMCGIWPGMEKGKGPKKERLDAICKDKPIILVDDGGHVVWMNSKALEDSGITKDTKGIPGGIIEKDPKTGQLWGTLKEEAKCLYKEQVFTLEEKIEAFQWFQSLFNTYGYTTILSMRQSASSDPVPVFEVMEAKENRNQLTLRICAAREIKANLDADAQIRDLVSLREQYTSRLIKPTTAKFFADGTIEGASGALFEPYNEAAGKGPEYCGELLWEPQELSRAFTEVLKQGLNIHVHAIGDRAVAETVDAMEAAQNQVPGDHRNCVTHLQVVRDQEIKRMGELHIVACTNPYWHYKDPCVHRDIELPFLGSERARRAYPLRRFIDSGVLVTSSADYPVTPDPNPFCAIQAGVTRNIYDGTVKDPDDERCLLNREERASREEMVRACTINAAYALHMEQEVGSLEVGKYADMIILDRDVFEIDVLDIRNTQVITTIFNGNVIVDKEGQSNESAN